MHTHGFIQISSLKSRRHLSNRYKTRAPQVTPLLDMEMVPALHYRVYIDYFPDSGNEMFWFPPGWEEIKCVQSAAVKSVEGKGGAAIGFSIQRAKVNAFPGTPGPDQKEQRWGAAKRWKWMGEETRWKGWGVERGTCGGRGKAGTEAEGVKNSKLKGETLKQEITGEDVASNMGQKSQSKTQSLTFMR